MELCFPANTEVLTPEGFTTFTALEPDAMVWQIDRHTLAGDWIMPWRTVRYPYTGEMINYRTDSSTISVTADHTMIWFDRSVTQAAEGQDIGKRLIVNTTRGWAESGPIRSAEAEEVVEYPVGCVSVPSGFILVRQRGVVFICGNCPGGAYGQS